ncbi:hypothetical protein JHK85_042934 [Glycine max]|nr:hypothetical protein JHK85_042934 [Glycine max]
MRLTLERKDHIGLSNYVPASFVFGDSLLDVGNNNYIVSLAKANHDPYGIDFGMATGRFSNGRTVADVINQKLGLGFSPPYLAPTTTGSVVLKGVNYASGAGGILNNSGQIFGGRINFDAQIDNFANTREEIISLIGVPAALNLFKKALFTVALGSNDFLDNYLTPILSIPERVLVSPESFVATLRLFNLGARKIVVVNVGPIGCIPYVRDFTPFAGDECVTLPNELAQLFNTQLKSLVAELRTKLEGSLFVYADVYHIMEDILQNYNDYVLSLLLSSSPKASHSSSSSSSPSRHLTYPLPRRSGYLPSEPPPKMTPLLQTLNLFISLVVETTYIVIAAADTDIVFTEDEVERVESLKTISAPTFMTPTLSMPRPSLCPSSRFENPNSACCHLAGRFGGLIPCNRNSKVCEDRSKYVFWDTYHPSDAANAVIAERLINGDTRDILPINICQLSKA